MMVINYFCLSIPLNLLRAPLILIYFNFGDGGWEGGGATRQGVSPIRVYFLSTVFSQGIHFLPIFLVCVPSGYTILGFLIVFYVLSGSGLSSPSGTAPSILVPTVPAATPTHSFKRTYGSLTDLDFGTNF